METDDEHGHYLMWTNKDGRPRRKEVLNPAGDTVLLVDPHDVEVRGILLLGRSGQTHRSTPRMHAPYLPTCPCVRACVRAVRNRSPPWR